MRRVRGLILAAWVLCCATCGNGSRKAIGEQPAGSFDGFVDAPRNQLAVMKAPGRVALLNGAGEVIAKLSVSTDDAVIKGNGDVIVVNDGSSFRGIDAAGRELWSQRLPAEKAVIGTKTLAISGNSGSSVIELASGKALHRDSRSAGGIAFEARHGYVYFDRSELWLVDEAGTTRWQRAVERFADAAVLALPASLLVIRPDRTFEELDYTDGKTISSGTCEGHPSNTGRTADCAGEPELDLSKISLTPLEYRDGAVFDFYLAGSHRDAPALVARDSVGRERWRAEWPVPAVSVEGRRVLRWSAVSLVAFVAKPSRGERVLLIYDDGTGRLLSERPLTSRDRVVGLADSCWILISSSSVVCIDARSGAETWAVPVSGSTVEAWPRPGDEALLLDGNPIALSRIDRNGRRTWQTELGDVTVDRLGDGTAIIMRGDQRWWFSDVMGVMGTPPDSWVIDLGSGKRTHLKSATR